MPRAISRGRRRTALDHLAYTGRWPPWSYYRFQWDRKTRVPTMFCLTSNLSLCGVILTKARFIDPVMRLFKSYRAPCLAGSPISCCNSIRSRCRHCHRQTYTRPGDWDLGERIFVLLSSNHDLTARQGCIIHRGRPVY